MEYIELQPKHSGLWYRTNYSAPVTSYCNTIWEFDIKQANVSVMRKFKDLPEPVLDKLENLPKINRNITIGNLERTKEYEHLKKSIARGIQYSKFQLFLANRIQDSEVLAIRNDAIFILGRKLRVTKFGPVEFICKNKFGLYQKIGAIDFFMSYDGKIVAKGLSDEVMSEPDHQRGMMTFLATAFKYIMRDERHKLRVYLADFANKYKKLELPHEYYRELKYSNQYCSNITAGDYVLYYDNVSDENVKDLNVAYNYLYYILPLIRIYLA